MTGKDARKPRKTPYRAGIAALDFKPTHDWETGDARGLYEAAAFPVEVDRVIFTNCIAGMRGLPAGSVDLVIADPPFGIDFDGKGSQYNRKGDLVVDGYGEVQGEYSTFTRGWIGELPRLMKPTASAYIFSGWTNLKDVLVAIDAAGLHVINHLIWKYQFGVFTRRKFVSSHYHVLFVARDPATYFFNKIEHYPLDTWEIPRTYRPGQEKNGTRLPDEVVARCIDFSSRPGDLVLDPFMGNGTTAACAKARFRHFLGFEVNEQLRGILDRATGNVAAGEAYVPYRSLVPGPEALAARYPAVKRALGSARAASPGGKHDDG